MTPDEMKVLARVANRNAIEESPIVVDESRLIAPVDVANDSGNFEERLDKLEVLQQDGINRVNALESQLGQVLNENDSPVKVLASVVAQTRAEVADLKSVRDVMRLNPADVLSGVIKPIKIDTVESLVDTEFTTLNANGASVAPYNESGVTTYKVRALKDIGEKPKNLINLDDLDASQSIINKLSGNLEEIKGFVRISTNNGINDVDLRTTNIKNVEYNYLTATGLVTLQAKQVDVASFTGSTLGAHRDVVVSPLEFYGSFSSTVTPPTNYTTDGYALVQSANNVWTLKKFSSSGSSWAELTTASNLREFTTSDISANSAVNVLFKNGKMVRVRYNSTSTGTYEFVSYNPIVSQLSNFVVIRDTKNSNSLYIVEPQPVSGDVSQQIFKN